MARTPFRWMLCGAGCGLGIFVVSFFLPLGGPHFPVGPAVVLRYLNWPTWWLMHQFIDDPGGDASQLVLYSGAVLLNGAFYGLIAWIVARALGRGAPWRPPDDEHG